jgi:hypothetical protein
MEHPTDMQHEIFKLCTAIILLTMIIEACALFIGPRSGVPDIMIGRILGWFESLSTLAASYWLSTSHSSAIKNGLVSKVADQQRSKQP